MDKTSVHFPGEPSLDLSIVIAVFNEEAGIDELIDRLNSVLGGLEFQWELVIVDDGSSDGTLEKLKSRTSEVPQLRVVEMYRNAGQVAALSAGMSTARGRQVLMMDGDLQHDPADIPAFLAKADEGFDLVASFREKREERAVRKIVTWTANRINRFLTQVQVRDFGSAFRLFDARILDVLKDRDGYCHYNTPALYIHARRIVEIPITQHGRKFGTSKWTMDKFIAFNLDFIASSDHLTALILWVSLAGIATGGGLYALHLLGLFGIANAISAPVTIAFTGLLTGLIAVVWRELLRTQRMVRGERAFVISEIWSADGAAGDRKPE